MSCKRKQSLHERRVKIKCGCGHVQRIKENKKDCENAKAKE
jgi:hypothetical protein